MAQLLDDADPFMDKNTENFFRSRMEHTGKS